MTEKKQKSLATADIDWDKLKEKYFLDPEMTLTRFFKNEMGGQSATSWQREKMKGWSKEKKEIVQQGKDQAKDTLKSKIGNAYEVPMEQLNNLKKGIFDVLFARLSQITDKVKIEVNQVTGKRSVVIMGDIPTKELMDIWKMVKTEMGEPTNINQSQLGDDEKDLVREITSIKII